MRKLKLESLQVESFETVAPLPETSGTVHGHGPDSVGCPIGPNTGPSDCALCELSRYNLCPATAMVDCTFGCWITRNDANTCKVCWISDPLTIVDG